MFSKENVPEFRLIFFFEKYNNLLHYLFQTKTDMIDLFGFHCTKYNVTSIFIKEKPQEVTDDVELVFYVQSDKYIHIWLTYVVNMGYNVGHRIFPFFFC